VSRKLIKIQTESEVNIGFRFKNMTTKYKNRIFKRLILVSFLVL